MLWIFFSVIEMTADFTLSERRRKIISESGRRLVTCTIVTKAEYKISKPYIMRMTEKENCTGKREYNQISRREVRQRHLKCWNPKNIF